MRPHLFVTANPVEGLRSISQLRQMIQEGHSRDLWTHLKERADRDVATAPILPSTDLPHRARVNFDTANRDWVVCDAAGQRIHRCALAALITEDRRYVDAALRQIRSLFDESEWPMWKDIQNEHLPAELRTGMLSRDVGIGYDWLHPMLTAEQRQWIVAGLTKCGIDPFWKSVEQKCWFIDHPNNWMTCIVGGLGIAGMGLAEDYHRSQDLLDVSLPRMRKYLHEAYGPEGEFNESVFYANATRVPIAYFTAHRYHLSGKENALAEWPFTQACRWIMRMTNPPGNGALLGDGDLTPPPADMFAAVADAARDGVLQGFYLDHPTCPDSLYKNFTLELVSFNAHVKPKSPEGEMPHGAVCAANTGCFSSRTDWNPTSTASVVYGKAGHGAELHGHHDVGTVCIDGFAKRLIVDLGANEYPPNFFGPLRYKYHLASVVGHNVLMFDGMEMRNGTDDKGRFLASDFSDEKGGWLQMDTTAMYDGVRRVVRTVIHLLPDVVAVLDEAEADQTRDISLRWHTFDHCEPTADGAFTVENDGVRLVSRVINLGGQPVTYRRGEHAFRPPLDIDRNGKPLKQGRESYVETLSRASSCRLLSVFCIAAGGASASRWKDAQAATQIRTPEGPVTVSVTKTNLDVRRGDVGWTVRLV